MQHLETVTVGSGGAASITFSAIPDTFTDLVLKFSLRSAGGTNYQVLGYRFNASTSTYTGRVLYGSGSSVGSEALTTITGADGVGNAGRMGGYGINWNTSTSNTFTSGTWTIPNYLSSSAKSSSLDYVTENNATLGIQEITALLWSGTSAITSVTLVSNNFNLAEFSSASLYGVLAGSDGIVSVS